jgi:hypothetical protein
MEEGPPPQGFTRSQDRVRWRGRREGGHSGQDVSLAFPLSAQEYEARCIYNLALKGTRPPINHAIYFLPGVKIVCGILHRLVRGTELAFHSQTHPLPRLPGRSRPSSHPLILTRLPVSQEAGSPPKQSCQVPGHNGGRGPGRLC